MRFLESVELAIEEVVRVVRTVGVFATLYGSGHYARMSATADVAEQLELDFSEELKAHLRVKRADYER
jgi:hypothetical protein